MASNEHARLAELNANRNRIEAQIQKRSSKPQPINTDIDEENEDSANREYAHKQNLSLLKSMASNRAVKMADKKAGQIAGEFAGGWVGSIIPFLGTAAGAFLGRYIGGKKGISGIIIFSLVSILLGTVFVTIVFFLLFRGYCDTWTGWTVDKVTLGMCQSIGSLQNVK